MEYYKVNHEVNIDDINKFNYSNQRMAVIIHIEDSRGNILLQQRGSKSRDESGLYEDVSGAVEDFDSSYKEAIIRELKEEIGEYAKIDISDSIGIYHLYKNNINWIFIIYFGKYISGEFKIMEPDKCIGYKFFSYDELISSPLVTNSSKFLTRKIRENI